MYEGARRSQLIFLFLPLLGFGLVACGGSQVSVDNQPSTGVSWVLPQAGAYWVALASSVSIECWVRRLRLGKERHDEQQGKQDET